MATQLERHKRLLGQAMNELQCRGVQESDWNTGSHFQAAARLIALLRQEGLYPRLPEEEESFNSLIELVILKMPVRP